MVIWLVFTNYYYEVTFSSRFDFLFFFFGTSSSVKTQNNYNTRKPCHPSAIPLRKMGYVAGVCWACTYCKHTSCRHVAGKDGKYYVFSRLLAGLGKYKAWNTKYVAGLWKTLNIIQACQKHVTYLEYVACLWQA